VIILYRILSKLPFNFSIFKKAKYICGYIDGKIGCSELLSVCTDKDLKWLISYLIERKDKRFKEILVHKPELLRLAEYTPFLKEVLEDYPEKLFDIIRVVGFINDVIIEEALKRDLVTLVSVCTDKDLKLLVDYLIERKDERFKEILAIKPELLRLSEYVGFWKEILIDYPEKAFEILDAVDFVEDARTVKEALKGGLVALDLEINPNDESFDAGGVVFSNDGRTVSFYYDKSKEDKFVGLLKVLSESNAILVGHNVLNHDLKFIRDKYNINFKNKVIDTLYLNCLVEPGARSRALSMLVQHSEHDPVEDAKASLILLRRLIRKIKEYGLEREAKELLADNPYVSGVPYVIDAFDSSVRYSKTVEEQSNGKRKLFVVVDWLGISNPWSPYVLDPSSYNPKTVWEKAGVFSALCAIKDPKCGCGDPNTFKKTWINDENTRKAILDVSKAVRRRELPKTSVETLSEYIPYLTEKFDEVELHDGELILSTISNLNEFFRLSDKVLAKVSLAKAYSDISETIGLEGVEFVDSGYNPVLLIPESSSLDPLNVASNVAGLLECLELPAVVLVSNDYEKALARRIFGYFCPAYMDYDLSAFRLAVENRGVVITDSFERIPTGFKTLVIFSDRSIIRGVSRENLCEKLCYGLMKVYGMARKLGVEYIAYLSFVGGTLSSLLRILEFGRVLSHANRKMYKRGALKGEVFVNVWNSVEDAVDYAENITEEIWGFRYRPYQRKSVAMLLSAYSLNRTTSPFGIVILPTGAGKSVIFQSVAVALHRKTGALTIVVSPLQALIQDQVESLKRRGVKVGRLDGTVSSYQRFKTILDAIFGNLEILYVTPERFERDEVKIILDCGNVGYVILDEVHCLSTWGSSFRPSYKYMAKMLASERKSRFLPIYGLPATLPKDVLKDVLDVLGISDVKEDEIDFDSDFSPEDVSKFRHNLILRGPAMRPEIKINIVKAKNDSDKLNRVVDEIRRLRDWLDAKGEPWIGLVFASFVRSSLKHENVDYIARFISERIGEEVLYFHGQMSQSEKREVISKLEKAVKELSKPRIVVATKAFGMGVDLPNIRFVIHAHVSDSIEDYYQEIGRGGRDRRESYAITIYSPDDFNERRRLIRPITLNHVRRLIDIIKSAKGAKGDGKEVVIPLNPFYNCFGSDGKIVIKKVLQILEYSELIEHEITNGRLVAYKILEDVDLESVREAIIHFDMGENVIVLDLNRPKLLGPIIEDRLRRWAEKGFVKRVEYSWKVGDVVINIGEKGSRFEMCYILLKDDLSLEKVSLSKEFEFYQLQLQKSYQLEGFFEKISSLLPDKRNDEAHRIIRTYLEEGIADEFEKKFKEKLKAIEREIECLGDRAVIFGLMGSGKTEILSKIATYYIAKYSERGVLIILPDPSKSDIVSRIKDKIGYDVNVNVRSARSVRFEDLFDYEVIIFDDVDVALAKSLVDVDFLNKITTLNRKVYLTVDPIILTTFGYFNKILEIFNSYKLTVLKSVELPFDVMVDDFNVRVIQREVYEAKRHRLANKIVKYLPGKCSGALEPAIKPTGDEYYRLLYLCLKASTGVPKDLKVDKREFEKTLTEWVCYLSRDRLELG